MINAENLMTVHTHTVCKLIEEKISLKVSFVNNTIKKR